MVVRLHFGNQRLAAELVVVKILIPEKKIAQGALYSRCSDGIWIGFAVIKFSFFGNIRIGSSAVGQTVFFQFAGIGMAHT